MSAPAGCSSTRWRPPSSRAPSPPTWPGPLAPCGSRPGCPSHRKGPASAGSFACCVRGPLTRRTVTGMASHTLRCTRCSQLVEHRSPFRLPAGAAVAGGCDCGGDLRHADDTRGPVAGQDGHRTYTPPSPDGVVERWEARVRDARAAGRFHELADLERALADAKREAAR